MTTDNVEPSDLVGRTVVGKEGSPWEDETGKIVGVEERVDGCVEVHHPGNIGKSAVNVESLVNGEEKHWKLVEKGDSS